MLIRITQSEEQRRKGNEEKVTGSHTSVGHHYAHQHMHNEAIEGGDRTGGRISILKSKS